MKVTPDQPDTHCVQSTHTLPSPGAQHAPQHNVKFHTAELPGLAAAGTHAWRACGSPRRRVVGGGQIATAIPIQTAEAPDPQAGAQGWKVGRKYIEGRCIVSAHK